MGLEPAVMDMVRREWTEAGWGMKRPVIEKWSAATGVSVHALYARLDTGRKRKKQERGIKNIEEQALIIAQIKRRPPEHRGMITTEDAMELARSQGYKITASKSSVDRVMREMGMGSRKRHVRYQADRPNVCHHVDASSSDVFFVARKLADGDYVLKLHAGYKGYKNKPVPIRQRPWIYGLIDDYSGLFLARYTVAEGENALDNVDFVCHAWSQIGIPEFIKGDCGPMMKSDDFRFFLHRLSVAVDPSVPGNKNAHGKIERKWRDMWARFEKPFFGGDIRKFEIKLSELNEHLARFCERWNERPHRLERKITRKQAWMKINQQGGYMALPADALKKLVSRYERTIDSAGCFTVNAETFECKSLHGCKAHIYIGATDGRIIVVNPANGEKHEAECFAPREFGDFAATPDTADTVARKGAAEMVIENTLYAEPMDKSVGYSSGGNVVALPVTARVKETAEIADLGEIRRKKQADLHYADAEDAIKSFITLSGYVPDADERQGLIMLMEDNGLDKGFIADLANEVMREAAVG